VDLVVHPQLVDLDVSGLGRCVAHGGLLGLRAGWCRA
jgi:hypothetical protein